MSHPFEVGKTYRNRVGEYVVLALDGDQMTIRYATGGTVEMSAVLQARIWENIHFEEQVVREEERYRLAAEARLAARQRTARVKQEKAQPRFQGFQASDFQPQKRGIAWSSRAELGKFLAHELSRRSRGTLSLWSVPRKAEVHIARKEHYDPATRDTNAALFVSASEPGVAFGFRVSKPDGKEATQWPWSALIAALAEGESARGALRAALQAHALSVDVYTAELGYGRVGQIVVEDEGFLWQRETADQSMTRRMNWEELVDYLQTVAPGKRCELIVTKSLAVDAALKAGPAIADEIVRVFEALLPVYDASVGV